MNQSKQTEQREQHLSSLLDNGLDEQRLRLFMQDLKRDPVKDAQTAQRYNLIGDVMREELDVSSFIDVSAAVHRAVEQEPELNQHVEKSAARFNLRALISGWTRPLAGMAVAASVAMVTLLTFNTLQTGTDQPAQLAQSSSVQRPVSISQGLLPIQRVNPAIARNVHVASTLGVKAKSPEQQQQLNNYLLQHSGYASQSTLQGVMPYVVPVDIKHRGSLQDTKPVK